MKLDIKWVLILLVVVGLASVGAYQLGRQSATGETPLAEAGSTSAQPQAAPEKTRADLDAPVPAGHPPMPPRAAAPAPAGGGAVTRDGLTFTHYRVGNRNIKAILADGDVMWVGTSGGVVRYDLQTDQHRLYDVRSGLLSNGVFHLSKWGEELVVGTYGGGLSILDPVTDTWRNYNIQHGLGDGFIYDALKLSNGDVWLATWSGANRVRGGAMEDRSQWDLYTVANTEGGLPNDWVYGLAEGKNGEVWFATEGGLARFLDGQWTHWTHQDGLGEVYEKVKDQIQFSRDPAKESSHDARQKVEQGLTGVDIAYNPNYIVSLSVDAEGHVWAGTWGGGLGFFDGRSWRNFTVSDGLPANHVFMLHHDSEGRLWVGTSNGLCLFENGRCRVFNTQDGLFADNVFSMAEGPGGELWIGSFGGVARIKGLASSL